MKKLIALLLAALMLMALVAGCTNGGTEPASNNTTSTTSGGSSTGSSPSNAGTTVSADEVDTTVDEGYVYKMPIADNLTLSFWRSYSSTVIESPADKACYQEMERRTGIHIDWQIASSSNSTEAFNLMVMSQDYADIIMAASANAYTGGQDKAIEDGVYLRLNEYVQQWAPNFLAMMNRDDATRRQQLTDQGNIAFFGCIQNPQPAWVGPMVRQDWLDAEGIADPVTYDDWYNILKVFKEKYGAVMALTYGGYNSLSQSTNAGFDVGAGFYNEEGTVKYGFIEDGFKDYLTLMNQWYNEGLLDRDFYTRVTEYFGASTDMITKGEVGIFDHMYSRITTFEAQSTDPDCHIKAIQNPVKNVGDVAHFRRYNFEVGDQRNVLTPTAAADPARLEAAVRWMDYHYTDEGSTLLMYGIEGESFEYDENGEPQFLPIVYQNPDGLAFGDAREIWTEKNGGQWYRWECENIAFPERVLESYDIWNRADGAWVLPNTSLTTEEGNEYSALYGDIQTYVQESIPAFITGAKPLSDWDSFVAQIKSLNIDRCIELQQNALTRYLNR